MKLKSSSQSHSEMFNEFDLWITPTLFEIKDTEKFRDELANTQLLLDLIGKSADEFANLEGFDEASIVNAVLSAANLESVIESTKIIDNTASLLFLVTGKSDNNAKCQFPLFLRDVSEWSQLPHMSGQKLIRKEIPRVLKSDQISSQIAKLKPEKDIQYKLFTEYVKFILDAPVYIQSLWTIGNSYFRLKKIGLHEEFLMPLIVFKVRGSVSASGGHEPEELLRNLMTSWGLASGTDFNTTDVVIGDEISNRKTKTRAYDFVLPYNIKDWNQQIFIQCQFYAGDSGSVSHKNVDQTRNSRTFTKKKFSKHKPIFLEYLDGAGYYSSLNGDLRSILSMEDSYCFFQVRTAPIKLRRVLQEIRFLVPLEIVHALALHGFRLSDAQKHLVKEGYSDAEIDRVVKDSLSRNLLSENKNHVSVDENLLSASRLYFLLDIIFNNASKIDDSKIQRGVILVPGLKGIFGTRLSRIPKLIDEAGGAFVSYFALSNNLLHDLEVLYKSGWIIHK